jgi:hypothetical protein
MNFKLRLVPLFVSIVISSLVLFGGWFVYNSIAVKSPMSKIINDIEGVEQADAEFHRDQISIQLSLFPNASLREIVHQIHLQGSSIIEERNLEVQVMNPSSPALDKWWSTALFDVAQAMENKQYSDIPSRLDALKGELSNLQIDTEMDQTHVYIRLVHGKDSKFIMLPRMPVQLGVWTDGE